LCHANSKATLRGSDRETPAKAGYVMLRAFPGSWIGLKFNGYQEKVWGKIKDCALN